MKQDDMNHLGPKKLKTPLREDQEFLEEIPSNERWWWIFQNPLGIIVMVALVILLVIGLWFIFKPSHPASKLPNEIIIVKPEHAYYKESSQDPAAKIDHQDKEVYKRLESSSSDDSDGPNPTVMKEDEQPLDIHEMMNSDKKDKDNTDVQDQDKPLKNRTAEKDNFVKQPAKAVDLKTSELPDSSTSVKSSMVVTNTLSQGNYVIRIASFRKIGTAEKEVQRVFRSFGDILKNTGSLIKPIENDSGVFYVVLIGAFETFSKAKEVANVLKEKKFDAVIQKVNR